MWYHQLHQAKISMKTQYQMTHISMQPLCNDSGGQMLPPIPLSQLAEMETQVIASLVQNSPMICVSSRTTHWMILLLYNLLVCNCNKRWQNSFTSLHYRLLPLILYKSHLMIRVMWLCWWWSEQWGATSDSAVNYPRLVLFTCIILRLGYPLYYQGSSIVMVATYIIIDMFTPCDIMMLCILYR